MALFNHENIVLAPRIVFGGDVAQRVSNGDFEEQFPADGVASGWVKHLTVTASLTTGAGAIHGGISAQQLSFSATTDVTFSFAQQLVGLDTNNNYGLTAYIKISSPTASSVVVFRVGPNSGSNSFQASATASGDATASYQSVVLSWSNTASNPWIWVASNTNSAIVLIDDIVVRSASASIMNSNTSTVGQFLSTQNWTLVIPNGVATPSSGNPYRLEVNNANSMDASKAFHNVHPSYLGLQSINQADQFNQESATASDFELNWINLGNLTSSAYVGAGNFRWLRVVSDNGFTGSASAFKAYLWRQDGRAIYN